TPEPGGNLTGSISNGNVKITRTRQKAAGRKAILDDAPKANRPSSSTSQ
ncbi:unnamed protein product, partial [Adineta ricciae]